MASTALAQSPGTVLSIGDGDTITINQNGGKVKVRLGCIDAAEMKQAPYGEAARNQLKSLLPIGTPVTVRKIDSDRSHPESITLESRKGEAPHFSPSIPEILRKV